MLCPLCGERKARRACPALGRQICSVCCGTKRVREIACPADCVYLSSAREHPPAVVVRQQQRDLDVVVQVVRDLSERQVQLFFVIAAFLVKYPSPELQPLIDDDVAEAAGALAATYETASRGVIYDHRPSSIPAERLAAALKPTVEQASGGHHTSAFDRDAAVVLRRIEEAARDLHANDPAPRRAFLELLHRTIRPATEHDDVAAEAAAPRLIVP